MFQAARKLFNFLDAPARTPAKATLRIRRDAKGGFRASIVDPSGEFGQAELAYFDVRSRRDAKAWGARYQLAVEAGLLPPPPQRRCSTLELSAACRP